mmetsp:Transcript_40754/g.74571  ORF Transcript_40754/g.74571 Transcript_40754/m.74571 type:complete len:410 (-) Transcript_40754:74-1303(-)
MGLLGKASHRTRNSAWANTSNNSDNNIMHSLDGHRLKRELCCSLTSQESMADEASSSTPTPPHDNAVSHKVQLLQRQLNQKDKAISQLRQTMEAGEKVQSERITLLERQLELLVEFSSSECARQRKTTISPNPKKNDQHFNSSPQNDSHDDTQEHQVKLEISALQELLARVVAEKDRLGFENDNLKWLLKQCNVGHPSSRCNMPSSIGELDSMINKEREKKCQGKSNGQCNIDSNEERQGGASNDIDAKDEPKNENDSPSTAAEVHHSVLYQLTCQHCPKDHSHLKYMGVYSATSADNTKRGLPKLLEMHFSHVWKMIQEENGSLSPISHDEEWNEEINGCGFSTSSLARHLVKHCQGFSNEKEVLKWCMNNIKVEIQKTGNSRKGKEKERRSKSDKKHKKRAEKGFSS